MQHTTNSFAPLPAGGARDLAKAKFKEDVKESGGVCFFRKFEQIEQMSDYGLQRLLDDAIEDCLPKTTPRNHRED